MDLNKQLAKISPSFNSNQKDFVEKCRSVFDEIDKTKIATGSGVFFDNEILLIKLIHRSDPDTSIIIKVDKYEIYIVCAGMGDSMFHQFPSVKGDEFYDKVKDYVKAALNGEFIKELYTNEKGEYVKGILKWSRERFKESVFMPLGYKLKLFFFKESLHKREFCYSSFLI